MILKFPRSFSEYSSNFFSKFHQILFKTNTFPNFRCTISTVPQSLIDILLSFFLQIPQMFFQRFTHSFDKITIEVCSNFYSGLPKNFLAIFGSI